MAASPVVIAVSNLSRAAGFYVDALGPLGFRLLETRPDECGIGVYKVDFWLSHRPSRSPVTPTHTVLPALSKESVRIFVSIALEKGAGISSRPATSADGLEYSGAIVDPDGNIVEVVFRPPPLTRSATSPAAPTGRRVQAPEAAPAVPNLLTTIMANCSSLMSAKPAAADEPANNDGDVRESDPRTLVGTLLGAAAGAALTYALCKSSQHSRREAEWQEALEQNRAAQTQSNELHAQTNEMLAIALQSSSQPSGRPAHFFPSDGQMVGGPVHSSVGASSVGSAFYNCQAVPSIASSATNQSVGPAEALMGPRALRMIEPAAAPASSIATSQQTPVTAFRAGPYATVETVYMSTDGRSQPGPVRRGSYPGSHASSHLVSPQPAASHFTASSATVASSRRSLSQATTLTPEALAAMTAASAAPSKRSDRSHPRADSVLQSTRSSRRWQSQTGDATARDDDDDGGLSSDDSIVPSDSISNVGTRVSATTAASRRSKARTSQRTSQRKSRKGDDLVVVPLDDLPEEDEEAAADGRAVPASSASKARSRSSRTATAAPKSTTSRSSQRELEPSSGAAAAAEPAPGSLLSGLTFNLFKGRQPAGSSSGDGDGHRSSKASVAPSHRTSKTSRSTKAASSSRASATAKSHASRSRPSEPDVYPLPDDYPVPESRTAGSRAGTARSSDTRRAAGSSKSTAPSQSQARPREPASRAGSSAGSIAQWRDSIVAGPTAAAEAASLHEDVRSRMRI